MKRKERVILAIDPGFDRVGWAVGQVRGTNITVVDYGCIETTRSKSLVERYLEIEVDITQIIEHFSVDTLAVETLYFSKNTTTAMQVAEARGVILACGGRAELTIHEHNPGTIKLAVTGNGQADKKAVEKMVLMQLSLPEKKKKQLDDAIDALAILMTEVG